jgi:hypothetical protein
MQRPTLFYVFYGALPGLSTGTPATDDVPEWRHTERGE